MMRALARWKFEYDTPNFQERLALNEDDIKTLARLFENLVYYDGTTTSHPPPPAYISKEGFPTLHVLNAAKMAAIQLTRGTLGKEGALTLLIGTKDADSTISNFCIDAIKRIGIDYEYEGYILGLYDLYFQEPRLNIQISIVENLSKSVLAVNTMPQMGQLIKNGFRSISS
jgi:Proteasome stabiliser